MIKLLIIGMFVLLSSCTINFVKDDPVHDIILMDYANHISIDTTQIEAKVKDYVIRGSVLQQQKKYAESILDFQQALKHDESPSIYYAIAKSYKELYRFDLAKEYTMKAIKLNASFINAYNLLSELYQITNETGKAVLVQEKIVKLKPTYNSKLNLANLYELNNQIEDAILLYEELLKKKENPQLLLKLAAYYEEKGENDKSTIYYEKLFLTIEKNIETYDLMLKTYLNDTKYDKALNLLDSSKFTLEKQDYIYLFNVYGNFLLDNQDSIIQSIIPKYLNRIDNNFYFDWKINMISGYLAYDIEEIELADRFFDRAVKSDSSADIPLSIAYFYLDNAMHAKAISLLDINEKRFPNNYRFNLVKGIVKFDMDSIENAKYEFYTALEKSSEDIETWSQLGLVFDRLKEYDSCDIAYQKVLDKEPDNPLINNNYAYSLAIQGKNLDKALTMSEKALSKVPNNVSYLDTYAWILYQLEDFDAALDNLNKAIELGGDSYEIWEHLGYIYLALNRTEEAVNAWQNSLSRLHNEELQQKLKELTDKIKD